MVQKSLKYFQHILQITRNSEGIFYFTKTKTYVRSKERRPQRASNVRQNHR